MRVEPDERKRAPAYDRLPIEDYSTNRAIRREVKGTNEGKTSLYSQIFLQERKRRLHKFRPNIRALIQIAGLGSVTAGGVSQDKQYAVHFLPRIVGRRLPPNRLRQTPTP